MTDERKTELLLCVKDIRKAYPGEGGNHPVLQGISLTMPEHTITVLLGKSGCGKTTLLRILAGLERADGGEIRLAPAKKMAVVFQEPRLMPWLTVKKNAAFGGGREEDVLRILRAVGLAGYENALPHTLSGGMQQRAALARALAYEPDLILMDEPFAALDYFTREQMQKKLIRVQEENRTGILFVTHNIDEALILGDRIAVMKAGKIAFSWEIPEKKGERDLLSGRMIDRKRQVLESLK